MSPQRISPSQLASLIPVWEIVLILSNLGVMTGVLRFWGVEPDWLVLLSASLCGVGFYGAVHLTRDVLPLRTGKILTASARVKRLGTASGEVREFSASSFIDNATFLAFFFFFVGLYGYFLIFTRGSDRDRLILWLGIAVLVALVDLYRAANGVFTWAREFLDGVLLFVLPALFLVATQDGSRARTTILAMLTANLFFYFCDRFLKAMADIDCGATFQDGLFTTMIRRQRFHAYAFFAALAYLAIVFFNLLLGVQWRLLSPVLFALPLFAALIVLLERVERGGAYQRKLIGALGMAAMFFVLYAELITVWIFA